MSILANGDDVLPASNELKKKYHYCHQTGVVFIKDRYFRIVDGKPQGNMIISKDRHGYFKTNLGNKTVLVHRLIWAIYYGKWPDVSLQIDHINRERDDNRIRNLRLVTAKENWQNRSPKKEVMTYERIGDHLANRDSD